MKSLVSLVLKSTKFFKEVVTECESRLFEQLPLGRLECQLARIPSPFGDIPEIRPGDVAQKNLCFFVKDDGSARRCTFGW